MRNQLFLTFAVLACLCGQIRGQCEDFTLAGCLPHSSDVSEGKHANYSIKFVDCSLKIITELHIDDAEDALELCQLVCETEPICAFFRYDHYDSRCFLLK